MRFTKFMAGALVALSLSIGLAGTATAEAHRPSRDGIKEMICSHEHQAVQMMQAFKAKLAEFKGKLEDLRSKLVDKDRSGLVQIVDRWIAVVDMISGRIDQAMARLHAFCAAPAPAG